MASKTARCKPLAVAGGASRRSKISAVGLEIVKRGPICRKRVGVKEPEGANKPALEAVQNLLDFYIAMQHRLSQCNIRWET